MSVVLALDLIGLWRAALDTGQDTAVDRSGVKDRNRAYKIKTIDIC